MKLFTHLFRELKPVVYLRNAKGIKACEEIQTGEIKLKKRLS